MQVANDVKTQAGGEPEDGMTITIRTPILLFISIITSIVIANIAYALIVECNRGSLGFAFRRLTSPDAADALIGDLEERFVVEAKTSLANAYLWFWSQVILSIAPLAWAALVQRFTCFSRRT